MDKKSAPCSTCDEALSGNFPSRFTICLKNPPLGFDAKSEYSVNPGICLFQPLDSIYLCPSSKPFDFPNSTPKPKKCFKLLDYDGSVLHYAMEVEDPDLSSSPCASSPFRQFAITLYSPNGVDFLSIIREPSCGLYTCGVGCCCFNAGNATVIAELGKIVGRVRALRSCPCRVVFSVDNREGNAMFHIYGPQSGFGLGIKCKCCCWVSEFWICLPNTKSPVGKIRRGYDGLDEDNMPQEGTIGVIFPPQCSPEAKAALIGAAFMIDISFFHQKRSDFHRICRIGLVFILIAAFIGALIFVICYFFVIK